MTLSPFPQPALVPTPAPALASDFPASVVALDYALVRGTEDRVLDSLLPRARQESLTLDLSAVDRIDAAGIATLITIYCTAVQAGTRFSILDPSPRVLELLRLVGLESFLLPENRPTQPVNTQITRPAA